MRMYRQHVGLIFYIFICASVLATCQPHFFMSSCARLYRQHLSLNSLYFRVHVCIGNLEASFLYIFVCESVSAPCKPHFLYFPVFFCISNLETSVFLYIRLRVLMFLYCRVRVFIGNL